MFDFKKFILDLFFPIQCLGCGREGQWVCQNCLAKVEVNYQGIFSPIGKSQYLSGVWVVTDYNQPLLAKILQSFKYNFVVDLGQNLAEFLIAFLARGIEAGKVPGFDLTLAVPLAKKRKLWRGFNQAEILAEKISQKFGWPLALDLIFRARHTHPQVGLKAWERLINVKGIFKVNQQSDLTGKRILLVDDVITTGATMEECAKVLKESGAWEVWGLVIAKG